MASRKKNTKGDQVAPKAIALAEKGIHTGAQFASVMSALLTDTIAGRIDPQVSNAVWNFSTSTARPSTARPSACCS
jgi:hypothetical protein